MKDTINYKGYEIEIVQDEDAQNPRTEWDNLGTMVCGHRRYNLGDKDAGYDTADFGSWAEMRAAIERENKGCIILPLYLYDHSGITMNTTGFSCGWDSGQVGFIYVSRATILKEYGGKIVTEKLRKRVTQYLVNEVATYDDYLTGAVYGYQVLDSEGESIDSCYGYYGYDHEKSGLLDAAKSCIDWHIADQKKSHFEQLKTWIKNHVPLQYRSPFQLSI
jgi:hypothetical protein